ncbi:hypothetical protein R1sor_004783 [Riccia sorocarpa]|uniref:Uncharacterized protein n=1 Tax=Riccia sorocarpa TaxID=122646 RepID=A0ABD3HKL0_9MARC
MPLHLECKWEGKGSAFSVLTSRCSEMISGLPALHHVASGEAPFLMTSLRHFLVLIWFRCSAVLVLKLAVADEVRGATAGRFRSCRRSASDLFPKEEEQPPELPEMTPLRWRSSRSQNAQAQNSGEQWTPSRADSGSSSMGRDIGSPAEQTASQPAIASELPSVQSRRSPPEAMPLPGIPVKNEDVSSNGDFTVRKDAVTPEPRVRGHSRSLSTGTNPKSFVEIPPASKGEPTEEIVEFQPVDLDQKYRQKELLKHITAAKIQNREESLLNNASLPIQEVRKAPTADEPAAMTIDFLRARLLAERQASKATKQQMAQVTKKIADLEARLAAEVELRLAEVELRKKAEVALQEALVKLNQKSVPGEEAIKDASASSASKPRNVEKGIIKANDGISEEPRSSTARESLDKTVVREDSSDTNVVNDTGTTAQAPSVVGPRSDNGSTSSQTSDSASSSGTDCSSPSRSEKREETKASAEERLRALWSQLGQEMTALAGVKGDDDKLELMGWMEKVPKVLQNKLPESVKTPVRTKLGVILPQTSLNIVEKPVGSKVEEGSANVQNMTVLVEQEEPHGNASNQAQRTAVKEEDDLPALVTPEGDVVLENGAKGGVVHSQTGTMPAVVTEGRTNGPFSPSLPKSKSFDASRQAETQNPRCKSFDSSFQPRPKTKSFDLSPDVTAGDPSQRATVNGRIETLDDQPANSGVTDELIHDEDAEELPNGIYLHHSKDDDSSLRRSSSSHMFGRTPDRRPSSRGFHSPGSRSERGSSRERFPSAGGTPDLVGEMDWSVREMKDRASRDIYYPPVVSSNGARPDGGHYTSRVERASDEPLYRTGPGPRWDPQMADPSWVQRHEGRISDPNHSHSSSEDGSGIPHPSERDMRGTYSYPEREHLDHDMHYRTAYRQRAEYGARGNYYRSMPPWQDFDTPGIIRSRSVGSQRPYPHPSPFTAGDPYLAQNMDAAGYSNYHGRSETFYEPPAAPNRADYYQHYGMPGPRPSSMNGYAVPPEKQQPVNGRYTTWEGGSLQQERSMPVAPAEDGPGEAGEVLKALRIAKQQIKSSAGEQQAYMTAQYTVSSEHRYGGGQVSKTSYTVEAPVGYAPRVTKAIHEGWLLEGKPKRLGMDGGTPQITDMNATPGPIANSNEESSYVEKLNVGRGIQFFFS